MIEIYYSSSQREDNNVKVGAYIQSEPDEILPIPGREFDSRIGGVSYIGLELLLTYLRNNNITNDVTIYNQDQIMIKLINSIDSIQIKSETLLSIKNLINSFNNIQFLFVKRDNNIKAISLAKSNITL